LTWHAFTDLADAPDDLVARDDRQPPSFEVALAELEVRAAHRARADLDQHLAGARRGSLAIDRTERSGRGRRGLLEDLCAHVRILARPHRECRRGAVALPNICSTWWEVGP